MKHLTFLLIVCFILSSCQLSTSQVTISAPPPLTQKPISQKFTVPPRGIISPQAITAPPQGVTAPPKGITTPPLGVTAPPKGFTIPPGLITSPPKGITAPPLGVTAPPKGITAPPLGVTAPPKGITAPPLGIAAPPLGIAAPPLGIAAPPLGIAAPPLGFTTLAGRLSFPPGPDASQLQAIAIQSLQPFSIAQVDNSKLRLKFKDKTVPLHLQNIETLSDGSTTAQYFAPQISRVQYSEEMAIIKLANSDTSSHCTYLNHLTEATTYIQDFDVKATALTVIKRQLPKYSLEEIDRHPKIVKPVIDTIKKVMAQEKDVDTLEHPEIVSASQKAASQLSFLALEPLRINSDLPSPLLMEVGQAVRIASEIEFADGTTSSNILWSTTSAETVLVDTLEGKIAAFAPGPATITAQVPGHPHIRKQIEILVLTPQQMSGAIKLTAPVLPPKPSVKISQPEANDSFAQGRNIKLEVSLENISLQFAEVVFLSNNKILTRSNQQPYSGIWKTGNTSSGSHPIIAELRDNNGNVLMTSPIIKISLTSQSSGGGGGGSSFVPVAAPAPPIPPPPPSPIIYVNAAAAGANDGSSWTDAFTDLQSALTTATSGKQIWVVAGTYKPTTGADRTATFQLVSGVDVYGGFVGTETALGQENPAANITILSGDLLGDDVGVTNNAENSFHVVTGIDTAILDGFTIRGGNADGGGNDDRGGGIFNNGVSPTLTDLIFDENSAVTGGAMANLGAAAPTINNGTFSNNAATSSGGAIYNRDTSAPTFINATFTNNNGSFGGAIYNRDTSAPIITSGTFTSNTGTFGGAMLNLHSTTPTITSGTFTSNTATNSGGAIFNQDTSTPTITNGTFTTNGAPSGGAIFNQDGTAPVINGPTFTSNTASQRGGAIYDRDTSAAAISNCTFTSNTAATSGGAIYARDNAAPVITNGNFTNNNVTGGGGGAIFARDNTNITLTSSRLESNDAPAGSGGGIHCGTNTVLNITSTYFKQNTSGIAGGAGLHMTSACSATISESAFGGNVASGGFGGGINITGSSSLNLTNAVIGVNFSGLAGGGGINHTSTGTVSLNFVTMTGNQTSIAGNGAGIRVAAPATAITIKNTIINGNLAAGTGRQLDLGAGVTATISFSNIQGSGGSPAIAACPVCGIDITGAGTIVDGGNNIDALPGFINSADPEGPDTLPFTADDGLRTNAGSSVEDVGDITGAPAIDILGNARSQGGGPDIGAYEH